MNSAPKIDLIKKIVEPLYERLGKCDICPRECGVNRLKDEKGFCGAGKDLKVFTSFLHKGEEPAISGEKGSGTIFFSGCNLKCIYCQNYKFSHYMKGKTLTEDNLAEIMLNLQKDGAHNINLVTPTHYLPQILKSLIIALEQGLNIPIVYNTSGYEKKEIIEGLEGIIDIYLTDFKYPCEVLSKHLSNAPKYRLFASESIKEMNRQVSPIWKGNLLKKGLIIRHLVLPDYMNESKEVLSWIKQNTPQSLVSLMFQYQPYYKANTYPQINRAINLDEYKEIKAFCESLELDGWIQDLTPQEDMAGVHFNETFPT